MDVVPAGRPLRPVRRRVALTSVARAVPTVALVGAGVAIAGTSPGGHFGLVLAVVPFLAAAVHSMAVTALIGALTVTLYAVLRHWLTADSTDVWLIKLGFLVASAGVAVLISHARAKQQQLERSRDVALALQEGLLPQRVPHNSAVETAYRYVPADTAAGVGGDWFDVIPLSGTRVALVMGDVVGHGIHAAAMMGRLRTAVHTLADLDLAPDELLSRMDDLAVRLADDDADRELGATCLYMVYDPISRQCTVASAGHTPPALVHPDGTVEFQRLTENPPLGVGGTLFESTEATLAEGTVIALYTDGLLDLRHQGTDTAIAALARTLRPAGSSLDALCDRVWAGLPAEHDDDVALLLARTRTLPPDDVAAWEFPARPESVPAARAAVSARLAAWDLTAHTFATELVVSELLTNAVTHARGPVGLRLIRDGALICEVSDGSDTAPHIRRAGPLDEGGRGLFLVAEVADRWGTRYSRDGKTIWVEQRFDSRP
ncbi:ATP-binding SpoIIE family protein phosphatase [Actinacidiphila alni]|uniref:ATP-binding SpoIIE family protein phosphatase n=1 Tax=Actinacidiphila alni TaxID=380248 RepID=UPI0034527820